MAEVTVEFGALDTGLEVTLKGIRDSVKELETQMRTTAMSTDEVDEALKRLKKLQGMEKFFMDLSGETQKLSESQIEAERSSQELAAAMKKAEEDTRALAEEQKKAEAITKANRTATEIYNQEIAELQKHLAAGRISMDTFTSATEKADQKLTAATPSAAKMGNSISDAGDQAKKAGGIFDEEFARIGAAFTIGNLASQAFQKAISLAFDAARVVVQGFSDALELGGRLNELSARTGEAAGKLLVLETAFKNSGLEASQVGQVITKLQNFMQDATNGAEKQNKAMNGLGITLADLKGKTPTEQMAIFAKKIAEIEDPTERAAAASEVWGDKLGGKLLPLLVDFSGNMSDASSKVGTLADVMDENAATFDSFSETIDAVQGKMAAFAAGVLSETIPSLQELGSKMEGVDAASLGKVIGQVLNPVVVDLTKNITLLSGVFDFLKTAASNVGDGLKGHSEEFKEGATQANKYLQVIASLLPSGLNPLNIGLKAVASISNEATEGMNDVADASDEATPSVKDLGTEAVGTGQKINTAFTLTADLKPELDSIGTGWKDVGDNIGTSNSLLEGTENAFGAIAEKTEEQVVGMGGVNDQLTVSGDLRKLLLDLTGKTADKEREAAEAAEKKAAQVAATNVLKQGELAFQLEFATAQAAGDTEHMAALTAQKEWLANYQKALAAGLGEEQAQNFATNMAIAANNSANIKQYDNDGNQLFFKAAENAEKLHLSLKSATGFADTLANMKEIKAMDKAANSAKAAREELVAMDKLLGTDLAQKSFPDLVKKLNLDKLGQTGEEQIRAVVTYMNQVKTDLSKNPIDSEKGQEKIRELIAFMGGNPLKAELKINHDEAKKSTDAAFSKVEAKLDADKSVKGLRESVQEGIEIDVRAKSGVSGLLDAIKGLVTTISTATTSINGKLPIAVVGA